MKPLTKIRGAGALNQHVRIDAELVEQLERMNVSIHPSMTYTLNDLLDAVHTMASRYAKDPHIAVLTNCGMITAVNSNMKRLKVTIIENDLEDIEKNNEANEKWERVVENLRYANY
jgi:Asp-tRNA(Asn)/Glu-tRNA(Gln) amidotransferase A subunit family amidase